jgi:phosphoribosylanthranilate isomerase
MDEACAAWSGETTLLVDNVDPVRRGGTGVAVDWSDVAAVTPRRRVVLAGGLSPQNVADAIRVARPYGVDVSSGVEASPGIKDFDKVARFVANARRAFEEMK